MKLKPFFNETNDDALTENLHVARTLHLRSEEISDYLADNASLFTRMRMEAHIAQCGFCADELQMIKELQTEGPGELDAALASRLGKLLRYMPNGHIPTEDVKPLKMPISILNIGHLTFELASLGVQGKTASDWVDLHFSEDKLCAWTYREDTQRNLIFKFTVFLPSPKMVQLVTPDRIWETPLGQEGNEWIAELIVPARERARLQSGDNIQIRVIDG